MKGKCGSSLMWVVKKWSILKMEDITACLHADKNKPVERGKLIVSEAKPLSRLEGKRSSELVRRLGN